MTTNTSGRSEKPAARRLQPRAGAFFLSLILVGAAGCSIFPKPTEDPTRYYLLAEPPATEQPAAAPHGQLHVGLRNVEIPAYLRNSRTLVVRRASNEIHYEDFARWAEPLDSAVRRLVRDRLAASEVVASAEVSPFSSEIHRDYDVSIRVERCEGVTDGAGNRSVQFIAAYEILDTKKGGEVVLRRTFVAPTATWNGTDYHQLVQRLSDAVAALGNDIAQNLPK